MKLYSKGENDPEAKDYRKGLSVNLSTALYHTIKQLHLKYELGNAFIQKWEDKCFNLSTNDTSAYNIMLKRNENMAEGSL